MTDQTLPHSVPTTPIFQTKFYKNDEAGRTYGNCTEASVATILGLASIDEVPSFTGDRTKDNSDFAYLFWTAFKDFLCTRGYHAIVMPANFQPRGFYLASGPADRGVSHMVVMRDGVLYHDPYPGGKGLFKIEQVRILVPYDPSKFKYQP